MLDSGPLGAFAHPRQNNELVQKLRALLQSGVVLVIPEIADYEVRRSFLLEGLTRSIQRLDELKQTLTYLPLTTEAMLTAAEFWAEARQRGQPTADDKALDGDVILAAQAKLIGATIITNNVKHLDQFVDAKRWQDI